MRAAAVCACTRILGDQGVVSVHICLHWSGEPISGQALVFLHSVCVWGGVLGWTFGEGLLPDAGAQPVVVLKLPDGGFSLGNLLLRQLILNNSLAQHRG